MARFYQKAMRSKRLTRHLLLQILLCFIRVTSMTFFSFTGSCKDIT